ncbi:MAG: competence/damage-inducible protein A [Bacteroidetes bacterium]|nr:MAG: competence/damage-inducible protein A [Bacteroidota bacterium]
MVSIKKKENERKGKNKKAMNKKGIDIISIGDELLIGQVINTNSSWMGDKLNSVSLPVNRIIAIADTANAISSALINSMESAKLVLITGGLGPTQDDLTKATILDFFGSKLVLNMEVLDHVESFFAKRGRSLTESNRLQAMVPDNCEIVKNNQGTAPAMHFEKEGTHFVFMPGVPFEMKHIMEEWVIPYFSNKCSTRPKAQKTVLTSGMGESFLADVISDWENNLPENTSLAYLPSPGRVRLRVSVVADNQVEADNQLKKHVDDLVSIIPDLVYGYNDDLMETLIGKLCVNQNKTIATAESCTGGMIAQKITSVAGSSQYYKGSIVAYANEIKAKQLGIDPAIIEEYGAVSEIVVRQMAENVRRIMNVDIAISTTGIAGPDGGTEDKPVGTVWIALATKEKTIAKKYQFGTQRERNTNWTVQTALNTIRKELIGGFGGKKDDYRAF